MQQKPDGDALILVDPKQNQNARYQEPDEDGDDAYRGRNISGHAVLQPCDEDAQAGKKERQNEKPEWNGVNWEGQGEVHAFYFAALSL